MGTSLLNTDQVAEQLAISVRMVRKLVAAGELRRLKIGRCARFEPGDIDAYLARLRGAEQKPSAGPITEGQLRAFHAKAHALDKEHGDPRGTAKAAALEYASARFDRPVTSPLDLSAPEASKVLDRLDEDLALVTA